MKTLQQFTVDSNGRLDIVLAAAAGLTRSQVQKLITAELVTINGKQPKKFGDKVSAGDVLAIATPKKVTAKKAEAPKKAVAEKMLEPEIIAETTDYVVLNKPSGLLVHPTQAGEKNTLASWLLKKYPKIKAVGDDPAIRPGIVHRLDKEASGLMVVAKTQPMFEHLKQQFKDRTITKEYLALAHGRTAKDWDELRFPIARGETFDRMAARPVSTALKEDEKEAFTEFTVEKRFANCTLLRVTLHTGRMHQIRVHMLAYNNPLVGDSLYFQKKRKKNLDEKSGRLFLHSTKLGFTDLDGAKQTFESPLPANLAAFLQTLR